MKFTIALAAVAAAVVTPALAQSINPAQPGKFVQITSSTNFCLLLPATAGQTVGESEGSAASYCEGTITDGARTLPANTITGAHVVETDEYIQVTGTFDYTKVGMVAGDQGGQYDNAPKGSEPFSGCTNYNNTGVWLSLVSSGTFCSRCCKSSDYNSGPCSVHQDLQGCAVNIPGDYSSGSFTNNGVAVAVANTTTSSSTTTSGSSSATGAASATHTGGAASATRTGLADLHSGVKGLFASSDLLTGVFTSVAAAFAAAVAFAA